MTSVILAACLLSALWAIFALWFGLSGSTARRACVTIAWGSLAAVVLAAAVSGRSPLLWMLYPLALAGVLLWWFRMAPSNDRLWADDVARLLTGVVQGNAVTLHNVRNFNWRALNDYDAIWQTRQYELDLLQSADAVVSHWGLSGFAHAMISFGFGDGQHVVFSVEIRKQRDQKYSAVGGFFRQFQTILVAADESDIIRVRTNVRGEDDYLYPLAIDPATRRKLFVSYVTAANRLAEHPEFYNSLSSNCTTMVYRMAREIDPGLAWDPRLLLTGFLDGYLRRVGAVDRSLSLDELRRRGRITERARCSDSSDNFSRVIREGLHESREGSVATL